MHCLIETQKHAIDMIRYDRRV